VRNDRERLADILEAAEKIQSRVDRGREWFDADEDMQIVLTHLVQVIGEAAARVRPIPAGDTKLFVATGRRYA